MRTWADEQKAQLEEGHPGWDVWFIHYPRGYTWHSRPKGAEIAAVHADTPEGLAEAIDNYEGGETNEKEDDHDGGSSSRHDSRRGPRGRHRRTRWYTHH